MLALVPCDADPGTLLCLDSVLSLKSVASGTYTIVLTVAGDAPGAVSIGSGTIGDGFEGNGFLTSLPSAMFSTWLLLPCRNRTQ